MQLEDYFLFLDEDDIRIKGHRIGIDNVLFYFLEGYSPEEIRAIYPDLSLEKIYATITYYLHNKIKIDAYLLRIKNWQETRYQESLKHPSPQREKMKRIKQQNPDFFPAMKIKFLLDENLSPRLKIAVLRLNPEIDLLRIGDANTLPLGTLDPEVLQYLGLSQRLLVTDNRTSMPKYLEEYWQQNQQIWGLFWVRPTTTMKKLAEELIMVWETSEAEEWINVVDWIPF